MIPFRIVRSGVLLAGLLAALNLSMHAAPGGFTATLSVEDKTAAGLGMLTGSELDALDRLVADDHVRARDSKAGRLPGTFSSRQPGAQGHAAGLDRLSPEQLAELDDLVTAALPTRPQPRERRRLKDGEVLSDQGRLRVHGGMSFTYGWAGGGRSFRETSAWVSYFDPVTGIGLGFGLSRFSGDGLYPGYYYYDRGYYPVAAAPAVNPRTQYTGNFRLNPNRGGFAGDGASMQGSGRGGHGPRGPNRL